MRWSNFAIWTFVRREWIEHPTPCSSGMCSTNWATTAYFISGEWWGSNPWPKESQSSTLPTELQSPYLCLRRNRTSIPIMYIIVSFISSLLWYDTIRTLITVALQLPIYALNRHFVGGVGFEPTVFLMYWVYSPAPNHHLSSPPIISSGWHDSNVRSPLQHAPVPKTGEVYQLLHIQIIFSKLINELKNKKSFVITEEALYKLYYIVTLITFLKIYFITIPISKRHAIKWTSTKGWTNNRTNMWINLIHVFLWYI